MQVRDPPHNLDRLASIRVGIEPIDRLLRGVARQDGRVQVLPRLEAGERVVRDQGLPLRQRRGVDRLREAESLLARPRG
jgi:hypothetical protein